MRQVILNFHGLGTPERPLEPGEAPYWVPAEFLAEVLELANSLADQVETRFTFDDGNLSDLSLAAPLLERHGRRASFFILADRIGRPGSLGPGEIRALAEAGHEIGSHGRAHLDWKNADSSTLAGEVGEATRARIAEASGQPVTAAAIPFGRYDATVLKALERQGYERIYSSDGGAWHPGDRPIPRTSPRAEMTLADIHSILHGREPLRRRLRRAVARRIKRLV